MFYSKIELNIYIIFRVFFYPTIIICSYSLSMHPDLTPGIWMEVEMFIGGLG